MRRAFSDCTKQHSDGVSHDQHDREGILDLFGWGITEARVAVAGPRVVGPSSGRILLGPQGQC